MAFKIRQNPFFSAGALPRTPLGSSRLSPRPLVGWEGDTHPIPYPTRHRPIFGARHASPHAELQPDSTPTITVNSSQKELVICDVFAVSTSLLTGPSLPTWFFHLLSWSSAALLKKTHLLCWWPRRSVTVVLGRLIYRQYLRYVTLRL